MTDLIETDLWKQHFQSTTGFDIKTGNSVCNAWMIQMDSLDSIVFLGMIWGDVKKRLSRSYDRYEKVATKWSELYNKKMRDTWENDVKNVFEDIKKEIEELEKVIKQKAETSKNYQELKVVFENAPELSSKTLSHIEQEKKKFDEKMEEKKFGYVTRRKEFYEKIIGEVTVNTNRLEDLFVHGSKKAKSIMKLNNDQQFISNKFSELTGDIFEVDGSRIIEQQRLMQPTIDRERAQFLAQTRQPIQVDQRPQIPSMNLNVNQARPQSIPQINNAHLLQNSTINMQRPQVQPALNIQRVQPQVAQAQIPAQPKEENKGEVQQQQPRLMINLNQAQATQMKPVQQIASNQRLQTVQVPIIDQSRQAQVSRPAGISQIIRRPVPIATQQEMVPTQPSQSPAQQVQISIQQSQIPHQQPQIPTKQPQISIQLQQAPAFQTKISELKQQEIHQVEDVKMQDTEEEKIEFVWPKVLHQIFYKNRGQDVFRLDVNGQIIKPQCFKAENLWMYRLVYTSDQKLYIIGGCNNDEYSHVYPRTRKIDIKKRNSLIVAQMSTARANFGVCLSDDESKIFVAGGDISFDEITDEVEMFDIQADKWTTLPKLNEKKSMVSLFCHNNEYLYCLGGYDKQNSSSPFFDTIERLSLKDGAQKWEFIEAKLPYKVASVGCVPVNSNEVLIVGGWSGTSNKKVCSLKFTATTSGASVISVEEKGELSQGDHFEQNNIFAKTENGRLAFSGHFGVHFLNTGSLKFDFARYH